MNCCCKIGCPEIPVKHQEIAYRNRHGYLIRNEIWWCKEHSPESILEDFTQVDLLKNDGGCY